MKGTKRWLAALLSAVLLMSLLPAAALAEGDKLSDGTDVASTANITRAQLAEMIYNKFYSGQPAADQGFIDIGTQQDNQDDPCTDLQWTAINVLAEKKIISGTSANQFSPKGTVTRGEAAVVLWRATGSKSNLTAASVPFTDVMAIDWYAPAIAALVAAGIITDTDNEFRPSQNATVKEVSDYLGNTGNFNNFTNAATRLEMVVDAYNKYKGSPLEEQVDYGKAAPFADISGCTADETKAIQFFNQLGIVNGYKPASSEDPLRFGPYDPASNLQVVMFLYQCAIKFDPETYAAQSSLAEGDTLSAQLVSYALPVPEGAQERVNAAWEFFGNTAGDLQNNADAPAVSATIDTLTGAITTPAAPTFTPDSDTQPTSVTLSAEAGAAIYYTVATDGSIPADPTVNSARYTGPISITANTTIKAVAVKNSLYSEIAEYTVGGGSGPVTGTNYPITIIGPTGKLVEKFPFHQAYDLAEELCSNAKQFGSELDSEGRVCAMDWHIEFGQLKGSLAESREDYETEDGNRLELRPVVVSAPEGISLEKTGGVRTYDFFRGMCRAMQGEYGKTARGKIKDLRTAFKQGTVESRFFLQSKEVEDLLYHAFQARYQTEAARMEQYRKILDQKQALHKEPFEEVDGVMRCLFFDAIEMIDHCRFFEEVKA